MVTGDPLAAVEGASRLLFLGAGLEAGADAICQDHLAATTRGPVLQVAFGTDPEGLVADWREHVGPLPWEFAAVVVGTPGDEVAAPDGIDVRTVASPGDLTELGIAVTRCLDGFDGDTPAVCVDSLTVLLQYVETQVAFRFVHTMGRYFAAADATVHAHLDPDAVDDRAVSSLSSLFDAVLVHEAVRDPGADPGEPVGDGPWRVRESP